MNPARLLLVSDEPEIGRVWAYALEQKGLEVILVKSAQEALDCWSTESFDLVVIEAHSSQFNELDFCRRLRTEAVNPILLFTARHDEAHLLAAYQLGVDECVSKPISPALFLAKVIAWLRRSWTVSAESLISLQVGSLRLDPTRRQVVAATGKVVKLTNLEFRLLHLLMSHQGQVLETNLLIDRVWGYNSRGDGAILKNVVYRLRHKIELDPHNPRYILTVAGEGYTFQSS